MAFHLNPSLGLSLSGCKVPESVVAELLHGPASTTTPGGQRQETELEEMLRRMEISKKPRGGKDQNLAIEFRYPMIDNPYVLGKIIFAEAVGSLCAKGITDCEKTMMLFCRPPDMSKAMVSGLFSIMSDGFRESCMHTDGVQTWASYKSNSTFIVGALASAYWPQHLYLARDNALDGDVLVLTKALGTQVAIDAYESIYDLNRWDLYTSFLSKDDVRVAYRQALHSMCLINRKAANLMHVHNAHGAMAVSGLGILHHANELALLQKEPVSFVIDTLPVIKHTVAAAKGAAGGGVSPLLQGLSPETSGGLLICMPRDDAVAFCKFFDEYGGSPAWIIGTVQSGPKKASIIKNVKIIEVSN